MQMFVCFDFAKQLAGCWGLQVCFVGSWKAGRIMSRHTTPGR